MVEWLFQLTLWYSVVVGLVMVVSGLLGRRPNNPEVIAIGGVVLLLVIQLGLSAGLAIGGERAAISTLEFFGYLIVALIVPIGAFFWAAVEPNRWATVVMGAASLTIAVMVVRMWQIWFGVAPF